MSFPKLLLGALFAIWVLPLAIAIGFLTGTGIALPFLLIPRGKRERYTIWAGILWAKALLQLVLFVKVSAKGHLELKEEKGALFLCNHRSWLDPILLLAYTRSNGLSKGEIFWIPVIGIYGWLSGAVFFNRKSKEERNRARDEVMMLIRCGHRIHVFPEGTRTKDGELQEKVYLTLAMDCYQAQIPVIPCAILHSERVLPVGYFAAYPFQKVGLDIGKALQPRDFPDAATFAEACWKEVKQRLGRLRLEVGELAPGDPRLFGIA